MDNRMNETDWKGVAGFKMMTKIFFSHCVQVNVGKTHFLNCILTHTRRDTKEKL